MELRNWGFLPYMERSFCAGASFRMENPAEMTPAALASTPLASSRCHELHSTEQKWPSAALPDMRVRMRRSRCNTGCRLRELQACRTAPSSRPLSGNVRNMRRSRSSSFRRCSLLLQNAFYQFEVISFPLEGLAGSPPSDRLVRTECSQNCSS